MGRRPASCFWKEFYAWITRSRDRSTRSWEINSWKNHPVSGSKVSKDDSDGSGCFSSRSPRSRNSGPGAPREIPFILSDGSGPHLAFADGRQVFLLSRRCSSSQACPCLLSFYRWQHSGLWRCPQVWDHGSLSTWACRQLLFGEKDWSRTNRIGF